MMRVVTERLEEIAFEGHPSIRASHSSTVELTKEADITPKGDCILGVSADKAARDLDSGVKELLRSTGAFVMFTIIVAEESFVFRARGSRRLSLSDARDLVIRRSDFVSPRTLAIHSDAAARDVPRSLVARLRRGERGVMRIEVKVT